jgi:hypothetical protein
MDVQTTGWTARALARMTCVPAQTITHWIRNGLVTPDSRGRGRGGHTIGVAGLMELLTVMELRQAGISMQSTLRAVQNLRSLSGHARPLARLSLVIAGDDVVWRDADELSGTAVSALRRPGQRLMVFPVGERHAALLHDMEMLVAGEPAGVLDE